MSTSDSYIPLHSDWDSLYHQKKDAERDLNAALPALEEAAKCLDVLSVADVQEIKSLARPPQAVVQTMECICILLGVKPKITKVSSMGGTSSSKMGTKMGAKREDYWEVSKELLANSGHIIAKLVAFDKDNIAASTIAKIQAKIEKSESLDPEIVKKSSMACYGLSMWVHGVYKYHFLVEEVKAKQEKLRELEAQLNLRESTEAESFQAKTSLQAQSVEMVLEALEGVNLKNKEDEVNENEVLNKNHNTDAIPIDIVDKNLLDNHLQEAIDSQISLYFAKVEAKIEARLQAQFERRLKQEIELVKMEMEKKMEQKMEEMEKKMETLGITKRTSVPRSSQGDRCSMGKTTGRTTGKAIRV